MIEAKKHINILIILFTLTVFAIVGCDSEQATKKTTDHSTMPNTTDSLSTDNKTQTEIDSADKPETPTHDKRTVVKELSSSHIENTYIGDFWANVEYDEIEFRFSLWTSDHDNEREFLSVDGTGEIRIINSEGEQVYSGTVKISKSDFAWYSLVLTGAEIAACTWEMPISTIKKSRSESGTVYLNFETKYGYWEEIETSIWGLPAYSQEELEQLAESEYEESAISVNQTVTKGNIQAEVLSLGLYTVSEWYAEDEEYLRVDMRFSNIGSETASLYLNHLAVLDNSGNQYESEYGGTLDQFSDIYPSVTKSGYLLFQKVPENIGSIRLVFELGHDDHYNPYEFQFNISLAK